MENYSKILGIDLSNRTRKTEYVTARFAIMYKLKMQGKRIAHISRLFGFHHSNVIHGLRRFGNLLETKDKLALSYWEKIKDK